jgi:hypothetical protein
MFLLYFTTISAMFLCKGESETSESEHLHGRKASCDKETYSDSHSSENSDEKKKSNLELLFVDNKRLSCLLLIQVPMREVLQYMLTEI